MTCRPPRPPAFAIALLCGAPLFAPGVAAAQQGAPPDPAAYQQEIEAWRANRVASLKQDQGWLADAGRFRLDEGESRVGSDPASRVLLPSGRAPAFAGTLARHGDAVTFVPAPGLAPPPTAERHQNGDHGALLAAPAGGAFAGSLVLADDSTEGGPTVVHLGAISFYVIRRFDKMIVRVKDAQAPAIAAFQGIDNFPLRADWRVQARFEPYKPPKPLTITNVVGEIDDGLVPGAVVFDHDGHSYRLDAFDEADGRLFIVFGDQTNAFETYGAGRFLDAEKPAKDGRLILDFNKAYNPPCAISTYAVCPLPPRQNRLPVQVQAGEKTFRGAHG